MDIKAKYKKCRKYGAPIFEKCSSMKFVVSEQKKRMSSFSNSKKRRTTITDYGKQLMEKQKLRYSYLLKEKQLKKYIFNAIDSEQETFNEIYKNLETRLDNIVYRLGLANSRGMARQMVSHGHIVVNGKKINIPSYNVVVGDKIAVKENSKDRSFFQELDLKKMPKLLKWLFFDYKKLEGEVKDEPEFEAGEFDFQRVIEFYTR